MIQANYFRSNIFSIKRIFDQMHIRANVILAKWLFEQM